MARGRYRILGEGMISCLEAITPLAKLYTHPEASNCYVWRNVRVDNQYFKQKRIEFIRCVIGYFCNIRILTSQWEDGEWDN